MRNADCGLRNVNPAFRGFCSFDPIPQSAFRIFFSPPSVHTAGRRRFVNHDLA
jgi:hypothetical protein